MEFGVLGKEKFIFGLTSLVTYLDLIEFIFEKKTYSGINNDEMTMKALTQVINSIEEFKNIKIPLKKEIYQDSELSHPLRSNTYTLIYTLNEHLLYLMRRNEY